MINPRKLWKQMRSVMKTLTRWGSLASLFLSDLRKIELSDSLHRDFWLWQWQCVPWESLFLIWILKAQSPLSSIFKLSSASDTCKKAEFKRTTVKDFFERHRLNCVKPLEPKIDTWSSFQKYICLSGCIVRHTPHSWITCLPPHYRYFNTKYICPVIIITSIIPKQSLSIYCEIQTIMFATIINSK